jgi:hypothetical protein
VRSAVRCSEAMGRLRRMRLNPAGWLQWEAREEDLEGLKIDALKAAVEFKSKATTVDEQVAAVQMLAGQKVRRCGGVPYSTVCAERASRLYTKQRCEPLRDVPS